ncbi:MAG: hypothetical protein SFY80_10165 [Verrucomicrobiota bacterium]|nr:hypothetical protein [Verrucomicrobiota bacterium]
MKTFAALTILATGTLILSDIVFQRQTAAVLRMPLWQQLIILACWIYIWSGRKSLRQ